MTTPNVILRDGKPYVSCAPCNGSGAATQADDPFCTECFGAGIAPLFEAARFSFARHDVAHVEVAVGESPKVVSNNGPRKTGATPNRHANKYPGRCKCGGWVEAGEGYRVRDGQRWAVRHHLGDCQQEVDTVTEPNFRTGRPTEASSHRPNRYPGSCRRCKAHIEAQAGALIKTDNGYAVEHVGECPAQMSEADIRAEYVVAEYTLTDIDLSGLPEGRYGVPEADTRLKVQISHGKGDFEGWITITDAAEYGHGAEYGVQLPEQCYRGKIADELRAIVADPLAAAAKYGHLTETCGLCGRALEQEESVARGIGPVCARKLGMA